MTRSIAYFSMEIALEPGMPTYSGGLGVLAGDTLRAAADLKTPMAAVTLLHRKGYFYQRLDASGWQQEQPVVWAVNDFCRELSPRVTITLEGRTVHLRAWQYDVRGISGAAVPVYLLDSDLPENSEWDRALTDVLYGDDQRYRLSQEAVLGIGGVRMLRAVGHDRIRRLHMNEGHAALLTIELLDAQARQAGRTSWAAEDFDVVRRHCVFTTHTSVPAGHDQFPLELARQVLGQRAEWETFRDILCSQGKLNMTHLALNLSDYINGVAKKHQAVSQQMFGRKDIDAITNGVHGTTWASPPFQALFDRYMAGWREDNYTLRLALNIPRDEIWNAHLQAKKQLLKVVNRLTNDGMDADVLTIGFARRATAYKRGDLLFKDIELLKRIAATAGQLQLIYAGKAHPHDQTGKEIIQRIVKLKDQLLPNVRLAYLENYDMALAQVLTAGVDIWLNTPQPPLEASGTSGMKAALNGVPSLSTLDGWWLEGCIEGVTGWHIGWPQTSSEEAGQSDDAGSLYDQLEHAVLPLFYQRREQFIDMMRHTIAVNGAYFNTERMVQQYIAKAYFR